MTNDKNRFFSFSLWPIPQNSGIAQFWQSTKDTTPDQAIQILKEEIQRHDGADKNEQERDYDDQSQRP